MCGTHCVHACTRPPLESTLGSCPGLLHTCLWPKGFSLRISDFTSPNPGPQPRWALGLGCTRGLLTLPTHLSSQPGLSAQLPYTDLALHILLLSTVGRRLAQGPAPGVSHVHCSSIRSVLLPMGPGSETNFLLRKGRQRLGADEKGLL